MNRNRSTFPQVALAVAAWLANGQARADDGAPLFERDVAPILTAHCYKCHGLEARKSSLDLRTVGLMKTGGDGGSVLEPGSLEKSPLYLRIADRSMPPKGELPLTEAQIEIIRRWVAAGAPASDANPAIDASEAPSVTPEERDYWAFKTPTRAPLPAVARLPDVRTPVDAFLLAKLEAKGLCYSPTADPRTLVRRAFLDLTGLPPSPEEISEFQAEIAAAGFFPAYERLVDKLLASPHFGERFGRHWLDAAGYVDVLGSDNDAAIIKPAENKWLYRDYVVKAFNDDKPFDRFLTEQLAGDEMVDWRGADAMTAEMKELLVATGYLRAAVDDTDQKELNTADIRFRVLNLTLDILGTNLLGLTTGCARCHTHKFDPIPQRDYYRLMAVLAPAYNPQNWHPLDQRYLPDVSPAEKARIEAHNAQIDGQIAAINASLATAEAPVRERVLEQKLQAIPEQIRADTKAAIQTPAEQRNEIQKYLAGKFEAQLGINPAEVAAALTEAEKPPIAEMRQQISALGSQKKTWGKLFALYDVGEPTPTFLLRRGDHQSPAGEVEPGFLTVLCSDDAAAVARPTPPFPGTSGRRLAFARWLTAAGTPAAGQLARVTVNRLWQQLFGVGIVSTSENFGQSGEPPTHPELLDWLAVEFIENGWRIKPIVRAMVLSRAYQQVSTRVGLPQEIGAPNPESVDPGNQLLWRARLRRLESESIRDSILAASGKLLRTIGGSPLLLAVQTDGKVVIDKSKLSAPEQEWRRSLYVLARRNYHLSMLNDFDQPTVATNCSRRSPAAVVSQSLTLMNDDMLFEHAGYFAKRVLADTAGAPREQQVRRAFEVAFGRQPTTEEHAWSAALLDAQTKHYEAAPNEPEPADSAAPMVIGAGGFAASDKPGEKAAPAGPPAPPAERALADLCHGLLSASEFLYIP